MRDMLKKQKQYVHSLNYKVIWGHHCLLKNQALVHLGVMLKRIKLPFMPPIGKYNQNLLFAGWLS